MKKLTKKLISAILLLGLIFTSFSPRVAKAAGDGKITVDNPKAGETYTLYRVFDLILSPDAAAGENSTYLYTVAKNGTEDGSFQKTLFNEYSSLDSGKKIKLSKNGDTSEQEYTIINAKPLSESVINPYDFSNWLSSLSEDNFVKEGESIKADGNNVKWEGLPLGYYMVKSTQGTLVSLNTTDKDVTIHEKNPDSDKIQLSKKVSGGVDGTGTSHTDFIKTEGADGKNVYASIGEELTYQISFNVHAYANKEYVLEDTLPDGISLEGDPTVQLDKSPMNKVDTIEEATEATDYLYNVAGKKLTFTFSEDTIQNIAKSIIDENITSKKITITYKAKLNNDAEMSNHVEVLNNKNIAKLTYDEIKYTADPENPEEQIIKSGQLSAEVDVRTIDFQINKFAEGKKHLEGATFKIYDDSTGGNEIKVTKDEATNTYHVNPKETNDVSITSVDNENVTIKGLRPGTYYIEETTAPTGYNKIQDRMKLVIAEDTSSNPATKIKYNATVEGVGNDLPDNIVKIENQKGAELPETGGMGRTLIYTIGGVLFFGALVLLIARKRTKEDRA